MDISGFEKWIMKIADRGLFTRQIASQIICRYCDYPEKHGLIEGNLVKIEQIDDEDPDMFIKLNQLINEMLY